MTGEIEPVFEIKTARNIYKLEILRDCQVQEENGDEFKVRNYVLFRCLIQIDGVGRYSTLVTSPENEAVVTETFNAHRKMLCSIWGLPE